MNAVKFVTASLAALGFASTAVAGAGGSSEFFYQPGGGQQAWTAGVTYDTTTTDVKVGDKTENVLTVLGIDWDYGFHDDHAMRVGINYTSGSTETGTADSDITGLGDVELEYLGKSEMGGGNLRYGAELNYSLGPQEIKADERSANSGQTLLFGKVGYEGITSAGTWGVNLGVSLVNTDLETETSPGSTENTYEGGAQTSLHAFFEQPKDSWLWGADLGYETIGEFKDKDTDVVAAGDTTTLSLRGYTRIQMTESANFVGGLTYSSIDIDDDNFDTGSGLGVDLGARMQF